MVDVPIKAAAAESFSISKVSAASIDSDAIHTCDQTRSTKAKQLDDGIGRYFGSSQDDERRLEAGAIKMQELAGTTLFRDGRVSKPAVLYAEVLDSVVAGI